MTLEHVNATLGYMQEEGADVEEAAQWFLKNYEHVWYAWFPIPGDDRATRMDNIKAALD